MKQALLSALFLCGFSVSPAAPDSSAVRWENFSDALLSAKADGKMLFVDIVADWCLPCREMDRTTYRDRTVASILNSRFHPVRLDQASQDTIECDTKKLPVERCFFDVWQLSAVPSYVLVAPKGLSILTYSQGLSADEMRMLLMQFLAKEEEWVQK